MTEPKPHQEEKLFLPDPEPEPIVVKVRAVCGGLAGIVAAAVLWMRLGGVGLIPTVLLFTVTPAVAAFMAARYGDQFGESWLRGG